MTATVGPVKARTRCPERNPSPCRETIPLRAHWRVWVVVDRRDRIEPGHDPWPEADARLDAARRWPALRSALGELCREDRELLLRTRAEMNSLSSSIGRVRRGEALEVGYTDDERRLASG
jgi:hypothetical protein